MRDDGLRIITTVTIVVIVGVVYAAGAALSEALRKRRRSKRESSRLSDTSVLGSGNEESSLQLHTRLPTPRSDSEAGLVSSKVPEELSKARAFWSIAAGLAIAFLGALIVALGRYSG